MHKRFSAVGVAALALSAIGPNEGMANTITLGFNSLPSAQGWTFNESPAEGVPDSSFYSVSGGVLHQNTLGRGSFEAAYFQPGVVADAPFDIAVSMRVTADETIFGGPLGHGAIAFAAAVNDFEWEIGIGPGTILAEEASGDFGVVTNSVDTTQFHNYLLEVVPATGAFTLLVDGTPVGVGMGGPEGVGVNSLFFGDFVGRANAEGDYRAFKYTTVLTTPAPEPPTWSVMLAGLALLTGVRGRRRWKRRARD